MNKTHAHTCRGRSALGKRRELKRTRACASKKYCAQSARLLQSRPLERRFYANHTHASALSRSPLSHISLPDSSWSSQHSHRMLWPWCVHSIPTDRFPRVSHSLLSLSHYLISLVRLTIPLPQSASSSNALTHLSLSHTYSHTLALTLTLSHSRSAHSLSPASRQMSSARCCAAARDAICRCPGRAYACVRISMGLNAERLSSWSGSCSRAAAMTLRRRRATTPTAATTATATMTMPSTSDVLALAGRTPSTLALASTLSAARMLRRRRVVSCVTQAHVWQPCSSVS